jgi:hypothetical protein
MIKHKIKRNNNLKVNNSYSAESLERTIERRLSNGDDLNDKVNLLFYDVSDGVMPGTNVRTDRFDVALDGMTMIEKTKKASGLSVVKKDDNKTSESKKSEDNGVDDAS